MARSVALQGALNFRDLGGLPVDGGGIVRRGRLYRAGGLHGVTAADARALAARGVRRVWDLRSEKEVAGHGTGLFSGVMAQHCAVPLVRQSLDPFDAVKSWKVEDFSSRYEVMLEEGAATICRVLTASAEPGAPPAVVHCSIGKDRTGVLSAVLLRMLGVPLNEIVADYALSEGCLVSIMEPIRLVLREKGLGEDAIEYVSTSPASRMEHLLGRIDDRWGSVEGYLAWAGLPEGASAGLRRTLILR